jgi:DNA invertase Pin-like site-specific DNA recombinase
MHNEIMIYGYARVSTAAQDESGQVKQLKAAGAEGYSARRSPAARPTGRSSAS